MYKETMGEKPVACAPKVLSTVRVQSPLCAAIKASPSQKKKKKKAANTAIPNSGRDGGEKKNRPSPHNECNSEKIGKKELFTAY